MKRIRQPGRKCSVEGCGKPYMAGGLCMNHYALNRRNGKPETVKQFTGQYIKDGYRYIHVSYRHYEPEHRLVMEHHLGRKLTSTEHVHHIDGDTLNNAPSNLQIVTRSEHMKIHNPRPDYDLLNQKRTHCPSGHAYTDENTYHHPRGCRRCRTCAAKAQARRRIRQAG